MNAANSLNNVIAFGQEEPLPQPIPLKAGPLALVYDQGFLRYIKVGKHEVLRMINHAVRDRNWDTIPFERYEEHIERSDDSFRISYHAHVRAHDIDFTWTCLLEGTPEGRITFDIEGVAKSAFLRNRVGFTVLHPVLECQGKPVLIEHPDGTHTHTSFPDLISPHQPFFNIAAMEWNTASDCHARLTFSGDVFETEDQRNWIDNSYKTYCTPLSIPFPVRLEAGDVVRQHIELQVDMKGIIERGESREESIQLQLPPSAGPLPRIGLGENLDRLHLTAAQADLIRRLELGHYRSSIHLTKGDWQADWQQLTQTVAKLQLPLVLGLFVDSGTGHIDRFLDVAKDSAIVPQAVHLFESAHHVIQAETISRCVSDLKKLWPTAIIGAGTDAFFTELNRDRPPLEQVDELTYSINPQAHASDHLSLVETLATIPDTVKTARSFAEGRAVHVGPITFKMRWNPNATGEAHIAEEALDPRFDLRQASLFGATWLLGCLRSLVESQVESTTLFETVGLGGVLASDHQPPHAAIPVGAVFPMYWVLQRIMAQKKDDFYAVTSSEPLKVCALAYQAEKGSKEMILGNFTEEAQIVGLPAAFHGSRFYTYDLATAKQWPAVSPWESFAERQAESRIEVPPFALLLVQK